MDYVPGWLFYPPCYKTLEQLATAVVYKCPVSQYNKIYGISGGSALASCHPVGRNFIWM